MTTLSVKALSSSAGAKRDAQDLAPGKAVTVIVSRPRGFSTVLSGVHYRFDVDKGLQIGRAIAATTPAVPDLSGVVGVSP